MANGANIEMRRPSLSGGIVRVCFILAIISLLLGGCTAPPVSPDGAAPANRWQVVPVAGNGEAILVDSQTGMTWIWWPGGSNGNAPDWHPMKR
jgi:hypothetical protein